MEVFTMEKYNEFAGIVSESEIDEMLDDNVSGGFTSWACAIGITAIVTFFANCPTTACSDDCRF